MQLLNIVDCFDGLLVNWNISTSPDALLVNSMLDDAAKLLSVMLLQG